MHIGPGLPIGIVCGVIFLAGFVLVSGGTPNTHVESGAATYSRVTTLVALIGGLLIVLAVGVAFIHLPLLRPFWLLYFGGSIAIWVIAAFEPEDASFSPSAFLTSILLALLVLRLIIVRFGD